MPDDDIEIEIEKATTGLPSLTAVDIYFDELKRRSEERKQEQLIEADRINNPPVIGGKMNGEPVEEWPVEKSLEAIDHVKELVDSLPKNQATHDVNYPNPPRPIHHNQSTVPRSVYRSHCAVYLE